MATLEQPLSSVDRSVLQTASESTLEEAEGVHVTAEEFDEPLAAPGSMWRFTALRRVWLRQVNEHTLAGGLPGMPPTVRCGARLIWFVVLHKTRPAT